MWTLARSFCLSSFILKAATVDLQPLIFYNFCPFGRYRGIGVERMRSSLYLPPLVFFLCQATRRKCQESSRVKGRDWRQASHILDPTFSSRKNLRLRRVSSYTACVSVIVICLPGCARPRDRVRHFGRFGQVPCHAIPQ